MKTIEEKGIMICDSRHGVLIPHIVTEELINCKHGWANDERLDWSNVYEASIQILLSGCDEELYWEAWEDVLDNLKIDFDGEPYIMIHNKDVWLIPEKCMDELE